MTAAGIAPNTNLPPACRNPVADSADGQRADRAAMLAPLSRLPGVRLSAPAAAEDRTPLPVEAAALFELELDLDPDAPHLDFVRQLVQHIHQVATFSGVVFSESIVRQLARVASHSDTVRCAVADCAK